MNRIKNSTSFSILRAAKLIFYKIAPLLVAAFLTASAYADSCPDLNVQLSGYVKNNDLVADNWIDPNNDWKLSWNSAQPYILYKNARLELIFVRAKTFATASKPESLMLNSITCEYKDEANRNSKDSLFLTITSMGQLSVDSYISRGGLVEEPNKWKTTNTYVGGDGNKIPDAPITEYTCTDPENCGKFSWEKSKQENGFWKDAWY